MCRILTDTLTNIPVELRCIFEFFFDLNAILYLLVVYFYI